MEINRKGIILAGGSGTRLYPTTKVVSKQLLMIYDKPLIYYPLSTLMLSGIREILIITTPRDKTLFQNLLGNGDQWGMKIEYKVQKEPAGLPQAYILGKKFLSNKKSALILGDNIFYGNELISKILLADKLEKASIFTYRTKNPERYGVKKIDKKNNPSSIEEKPKNPKSNLAITGLYLFDENASIYSLELKPSRRGELEITDLIKKYLSIKSLNVEILGRGFAWLDTGTFDTMLDASSFVKTIQERQGLIIASPDEIAFNNKWINEKKLIKNSNLISNGEYKKYLFSLIN